MNPFRLVKEIVEDDRRSPGWKTFDVTLLTVLWVGSVFLLFLLNTDWIVLAKIWWPATLVASARSWYMHPRRRRPDTSQPSSSEIS
jgi:hypothetical protein